MKFVIDDIEIFIPTHNRADYLAQAIESILNQTASVKSLTVLDNESTDNTQEVVKNFENRGVKYIKTHGFLGNFNKAQEIASKKYVMLVHDDDILHPKYLEFALKALNKYRNISLITTRYTEFLNDEIPSFAEKISSNHYLFKSQKDFAKHMYYIERIAYSPAIYRTSDFIKNSLEYEKFNKFNDWPFMVKIAKYGKTVLFDDWEMFLARKHSGQDTWTFTNMPSLEQIVNWDKFFYNAMKLKNKFLPINIREKIMFNLKSEYYMLGKYNSFLSPQDREKFSFDNLNDIAVKLGIKFEIKYFSKAILREVKRRYLKKIQSKNKRGKL